jgi:hypothetical protein
MALESSAQIVRAAARGPFVVDDPSRPVSDEAVDHLEDGGVLLLPPGRVPFAEADRAFLIGLQQASTHKNIAYRPLAGKLTGASRGTDTARLHDTMRRFSEQAVALVATLLPRYAAGWRLDFASFRPVEEQGRPLSPHARNDLLHFDAFPTRPSNGRRILRFFININPTEDRVWIISDPFDIVANRLGRDPHLLPLLEGEPPRALGLLRALGFKQAARPPYDRFMMRFHHALKDNADFQRTCPKYRLELPPGACWMVFTDMTSHAVLSGRFALEQTFSVPPALMAHPERAPAAILEQLCGHPVTWPA